MTIWFPSVSAVGVCAVAALSVPIACASAPPTTRFELSAAELQCLVGRLGKLLDDGTDPATFYPELCDSVSMNKPSMMKAAVMTAQDGAPAKLVQVSLPGFEEIVVERPPDPSDPNLISKETRPVRRIVLPRTYLLCLKARFEAKALPTSDPAKIDLSDCK